MLCAAALGLGLGCSRTPGSKQTASAPANSVGTFRSPECRSASGKTSRGPAATYYLASRGARFELTELADAGTGSRISNYWRDPAGHNFVTYQKRGPAWHYIIPDDRNQPGKRMVFAKGTYTIDKQLGTERVRGTPTVECPLVHAGQGAQPAVAAAPEPPAPAPEPPPPATVCAPGSTQECIGTGACRGGQVCAADGKTWGSCDCGPPVDPTPTAEPPR
jgi:hypothetical protein